MGKMPEISVGIMFEKTISFALSGMYRIGDKRVLSGNWKASITDDKIKLDNGNEGIVVNQGIVIAPEDAKNSFTLFDVTIGIDFHWQRKENQAFNGSLKLIIENNKITAVNVINVEDYLISVISSEMSATSSLELLKAHAVISRSWLLAQIQKKTSIQKHTRNYETCIETEDERIRWYDREDHINFDVCADDHCQRYQGITRSTTKSVEEAVTATKGEVLLYDGKVCDTRFSKCCGGVSESFEHVWEPVVHPYLSRIIDNNVAPSGYNLNLEDELNAQKWILGEPDAYCNTNDKEVLKQVLNDYDQETNDYYRWQVKYTQEELSELVKERTGIDFGVIQSLTAIERGVSGRIKKLKIVGDKKTLTIGKELEIRKALSKSHLYSSAFTVSKDVDNTGKIIFVLTGAGWGHGVGLCQIGAAVMGHKGFMYDKILKHYFKEAKLEHIY